jgi:hypothetical protein
MPGATAQTCERGPNAEFSGGRPVRTCQLERYFRLPVRCNAGFGANLECPQYAQYAQYDYSFRAAHDRG